MLDRLIRFFKNLFARLRFIPRKNRNDPGEVVDYYGCPNSDRTKKLQYNTNKIR